MINARVESVKNSHTIIPGVKEVPEIACLQIRRAIIRQWIIQTLDSLETGLIMLEGIMFPGTTPRYMDS